MGAETCVIAEVDGERVTARAPARFGIDSGAEVWLRADPSRAIWFDEKTEKRIREA